MALKLIGGCGIVLGLLLLLAAFAQPATVTETSTTCVDTTYYGQDCSTVEYERPNHTRSQLFGGGVFFLVSGLITYGIGASRNGNSSSPTGSSSLGTDSTDGREDNAMTLREQLDAKTNRERTADTEPSVRTDSVDAVGETTPPTAELSTESTRSASGRGTSAFLKLIASGLVAAFVLTWVLSGAFVVESPVGRAVLFALCSLPGIGLYTRYSSDESAIATPATEGSDR